MNEKHVCCFLVTCNGRAYVGRTHAYYQKRYDMMKKAAAYPLHDATIYAALRLYPATWQRFPCSVRELARLEAQLITEHDTTHPHGYNNVHARDFTRALISKNYTEKEKSALRRRSNTAKNANHLALLIDSYMAAGETRGDAEILAERAIAHGA